MDHGIFGHVRKYHIMNGIDFYTQEYDSSSGFCSVPGDNNVLEIHWCRRGRMECRMKDGCILYMGEGDMFLSMTDNHADVLSFPTGSYSGAAVSLDPAADAYLPPVYKESGISISDLTEKFFVNDDCFLLKACPLTERFFESVYLTSEKLRPIYIKLKTMELVLMLSQIDIKSASPMTFYHRGQTDVVKEIEKLMRSNISKKYTIDTLASEFCISATALKSTFRDVFGTPPAAYMKHLRMEKAAELLLTDMSGISEIANAVGYESSSKFAKAFKAEFGLSPAEYRRKRADNQKNTDQISHNKSGKQNNMTV